MDRADPSNQDSLESTGQHDTTHQVNGPCHVVPNFFKAQHGPWHEPTRAVPKKDPPTFFFLFFQAHILVFFQAHVTSVLYLSPRAWCVFFQAH